MASRWRMSIRLYVKISKSYHYLRTVNLYMSRWIFLIFRWSLPKCFRQHFDISLNNINSINKFTSCKKIVRRISEYYCCFSIFVFIAEFPFLYQGILPYDAPNKGLSFYGDWVIWNLRSLDYVDEYELVLCSRCIELWNCFHCSIIV